MVHAETSTGVLNPVRELAGIAREHGALTIVDAVTSFGGHPLDVGAWGIDACYSCTQKCLGAPVGAGAGRVRAARARAPRQVPQLLFRSGAARGLLAAPEVSPHDVLDAGLRAVRSAGDRRRRRARGAMGAPRAEPSGARRRAGHRSACRCCRPKANGCGRSTPCASPTAWTRRPRASNCSTSSTSRSAPDSVRWPARSGASA